MILKSTRAQKFARKGGWVGRLEEGQRFESQEAQWVQGLHNRHNRCKDFAQEVQDFAQEVQDFAQEVQHFAQEVQHFAQEVQHFAQDNSECNSVLCCPTKSENPIPNTVVNTVLINSMTLFFRPRQ